MVVQICLMKDQRVNQWSWWNGTVWGTY